MVGLSLAGLQPLDRRADPDHGVAVFALEGRDAIAAQAFSFPPGAVAWDDLLDHLSLVRGREDLQDRGVCSGHRDAEPMAPDAVVGVFAASRIPGPIHPAAALAAGQDHQRRPSGRWPATRMLRS